MSQEDKVKPRPQRGNDRQRMRLRLANLEADVAYFQARLEIIGDPITSNQRAQRKVFKLLYKSVGERIVRAKKQLLDAK